MRRYAVRLRHTRAARHAAKGKPAGTAASPRIRTAISRPDAPATGRATSFATPEVGLAFQMVRIGRQPRPNPAGLGQQKGRASGTRPFRHISMHPPQPLGVRGGRRSEDIRNRAAVNPADRGPPQFSLGGVRNVLRFDHRLLLAHPSSCVPEGSPAAPPRCGGVIWCAAHVPSSVSPQMPKILGRFYASASSLGVRYAARKKSSPITNSPGPAQSSEKSRLNGSSHKRSTRRRLRNAIFWVESRLTSPLDDLIIAATN